MGRKAESAKWFALFLVFAGFFASFLVSLERHTYALPIVLGGIFAVLLYFMGRRRPMLEATKKWVWRLTYVVVIVMMLLPVFLGREERRNLATWKYHWTTLFNPYFRRYTERIKLSNSRVVRQTDSGQEPMDMGQALYFQYNRMKGRETDRLFWTDAYGNRVPTIIKGKIVPIRISKHSNGGVRRPTKKFEPSFHEFDLDLVRRLPGKYQPNEPKEVGTILWIATDRFGWTSGFAELTLIDIESGLVMAQDVTDDSWQAVSRKINEYLLNFPPTD